MALNSLFTDHPPWADAVALELLVEGGGQEAERGRRLALVPARGRQRGEEQLPLVGAHARAEVRGGIVRHGGAVGRRIALLVAHARLTRCAGRRRDRRAPPGARAGTTRPRRPREAGRL